MLFVAVLLPLWACYLARVYAWMLILNHGGFLELGPGSLGLGPAQHRLHEPGGVLVFSYIWLPFMIIPVYAALERVPGSLLEAAAGPRRPDWRAIREVVLPLALPGIVAGSIFTFSLTLGDYITPISSAAPARASSATSSTPTSASPTTCRSPRPWRWCRSRSWPSTCSGARASARSRRCRGGSAGRTGRAARLGRAGPALPVHTDPADRALCVRPSKIESWPIPGLTTQWFAVA